MPRSNQTMIQLFHWYSPANGTLWDEITLRAQKLADAGFTAAWLPPAYKGFNGENDVGYGVYDLYDLGEFEQRGSVKTKYGYREQYLTAIRALQSAKIKVYADAVLHQRIGGETTEITPATPFDKDNPTGALGKMRNIESFTQFTFPGRQGKYSTFQWHWWHFFAVDHDNITHDFSKLYLFEGKHLDTDTNYYDSAKNYLLGCAVDLHDEHVRNELIDWGKWYLDTTGVDGFRLDSLKYNLGDFFLVWLDELSCHAGRSIDAVGELWHQDLTGFLDSTKSRFPLFDIPLHYNFHEASIKGNTFNMAGILDGTLMLKRPDLAVTFVENSDTQLLASDSYVQSWFKPLAYAIILLRSEGCPCIFLADYDGAGYEDQTRDGSRIRVEIPPLRNLLDIFLKVRKLHAYGDQKPYFDHINTVGWTRTGDDTHPKALAVIMSTGDLGWKWMDVCRSNAKFIDVTGQITEPVLTNESGWGEFKCKGGAVSLWVQE